MIGDNTKEYETIKALGETYPLAYNLNVAARLQATFGSQREWIDKIYPKDGEPDLNALIETCKEFINEGIDIQNDTTDKKREFITKKMAGRILTAVGTGEFLSKMADTNKSESTEEPEDETEEDNTPS